MNLCYKNAYNFNTSVFNEWLSISISICSSLLRILMTALWCRTNSHSFHTFIISIHQFSLLYLVLHLYLQNLHILDLNKLFLQDKFWLLILLCKVLLSITFHINYIVFINIILVLCIKNTENISRPRTDSCKIILK